MIDYFDDETRCRSIAREFSKSNDITRSSLWANQRGEGGVEGGFSSEISSKGGKIGGKVSKERGLGIHTKDKELKSKWCRMGGLVGGKKQFEMKIGIHSVDFETNLEALKRAREIQIEKKANRFIFATREEQAERGRKGGTRNKNTLWYNDGIVERRFRPSQSDITFEEFLSQNNYLRGRIKR